MYNTSYTVTQEAASDFYLLANDDVLADNQGSITLKVEICKDAAGDWPVVYDFSTGQHNWIFNGGTDWGACGSYVPGTGFATEIGCGTTQAVGIKIDFGFPVNLTQIKVTGHADNNINGGLREVNRLDSSFIGSLPGVGGDFTTTINLVETMSGLIILLSNGGAVVGTSYIYSVEINGTGLAPSP